MTALGAALWIFGAGAAATAAVGLTRRNPMVAVVWLMLTFGCIAGLAAAYDAHLVAVLQILVYAGAIMSLFVLAVFLVDARREEMLEAFRGGPARLLAGVAGAVALWRWIGRVRAFPALAPAPAPAGFGSPAAVGRTLFVDYALPFEVLSLLLVVAIVGAVLVAGRPAGGGRGGKPS